MIGYLYLETFCPYCWIATTLISCFLLYYDMLQFPIQHSVRSRHTCVLEPVMSTFRLACLLLFSSLSDDRSKASSFKWEYPLLSLRSSSSFLRLLPRLLVTSTSPFIFPSITWFRRQFLRKMWPIQLAFRFRISRRIFYLAYRVNIVRTAWLQNCSYCQQNTVDATTISVVKQT